MYNLTNKVAVITGSGRHKGIGEAIALKLAAEGCNLVISDIGEAKGEAFTEEHIGATNEMNEIATACELLGVKVISVPCDVRNENDCANLMSQAVSAFGKIDILVNNAGVGYIMEPFTEFKESSWDAVLGVNLKGAFLCSKHAAIQMQQQATGGSIVNIAAMLGQVAKKNASAHVATKHAVVGLTKAVALEYAEKNIRVNVVGPGYIKTPMLSNQFDETGMKSLESLIPLGRLGEASEVAELILWLSSPKSSFVTGSYYGVDGGYLAQ